MLKSAHTPANQGGGTLQQRQKIGGGLFIAHQQLAEAVEPRVGAFDHPAFGEHVQAWHFGEPDGAARPSLPLIAFDGPLTPGPLP